MPVRENDSVYRSAFESASAELSEIYARAEELLVRKEKVEAVLTALEPLIFRAQATEVGRVSAQADSFPEVSEQVLESLPTRIEPQTLAPAALAEDGSDPIQRKINSILGLAVA